MDKKYEERNVMVYLYGTKLNEDEEAIDMYLYRLAEEKAKKIAKVTRLLKENSIDCLLNKKGQDYSQDRINKVVKQKLSNQIEIEHRIGEMNNSLSCDFTMCNYDCNTRNQVVTDVNMTTYNENFILMNGYGIFVWLSFFITFLVCGILYYKTYRTLKKYEKEFAKEIEELSIEQKKTVLENSKIASKVLSSYNKTI